MNMEALNKIGMVMQATGMGLKGQDGSAVYTRYNEDQEKAKRKEAIGGLMERLNIAGPKRDFLSTLPLEQQQELMWEMMNPEPVRGVVAGDKLINPFDGSIMGNYGPEPYTSEELAALTGSVSPEFAQHVPGIFAGESGGDFNALFGYSNRPGGRFEGVNLTDMTVDEAIQFSRPDGEYAKWVAAQNGGTIATPMGGFQVVGRTLRHIKQELGLTGQEKMTPELQMKIGEAIYRTQGTGAWEGYKPGRPGGGGQPAQPTVAQLDKRINDYTALLAKSKGSPEIRKQMEFKRSELVKQRDAIAGKKEPFRQATPEEANRYGAQAGQFGPDGRFYPINPPDEMVLESDGQGGVTFRQGAAGEKAPKLTERQSMLTLFGSMMDVTMPIINGLENKFDPANLPDHLAKQAGTVGNYFTSAEMQQYTAAGRAWAEGVLRIQTGAAAPEPEIERVFQTYFAQPGDDPSTVRYKRRLREEYGKSVGLAGSLVTPSSAPNAGDDSGSPGIGGQAGAAAAKVEADLRAEFPDLFEN